MASFGVASFRKMPIWANVSLVVMGCALLALYRIGLRAHGAKDIFWIIKLALVQSIIYLVAAYLVVRTRPARSTVILIVVFAVLFRLAILFAPPYLSDDIYRYVWDGRVQAASINPYRYVPSDPALAHLRDTAAYPKINRRDIAPTIYPPAAQMIYFVATRVSTNITWMKAVMVGFEALTFCALILLLSSFKIPVQRMLLYAWHPLVVWEFAGSGHVDAAMIAFIAVALFARRRNWQTVTGIALAGATLIKFFPVVLLAALYKRWDWKMPVAFVVTVVIAYLPYLSVGMKVLGYLPGYAREEGINSGSRFFLLNLVRRLVGETYPSSKAFIIFALLVLFVVALWTLWSYEGNDGYVRKAFTLALLFTILLSPHFAWYFAWLVPFLALLPSAPILLLTVAPFMLYVSWLDDSARSSFAVNSYIFLPFVLIGAITILQRRAARRKDLRASKSVGQTAEQKAAPASLNNAM